VIFRRRCRPAANGRFLTLASTTAPIRASRRRARRRRARASSWRRWGARTVRSAGPRTDWPENAPAFVTHAGVTLTGSTIPKASSLLARVQAAAKRARAQAAPRVEQRWPEQRSPPHQPRFTAEGRPVANCCSVLSYVRNMCHGCQAQFVFVFVFVFVTGWHAYSPRVLSTGGSPRVHGWLSTGPHGWLSTGPGPTWAIRI